MNVQASKFETLHKKTLHCCRVFLNYISSAILHTFFGTAAPIDIPGNFPGIARF